MQVIALAALFAAALAIGVAAPADDDCCAVSACSGQDHEGSASDECPPGCDDGCVCCARLTGVAESAIAPVLLVRIARIIEYVADADVGPTPPEPRDRDFVPRRAASAI